MVEENYRIKDYYPTIGIECHVQLKTKTKLFASVSNEAREAAPNTLVSHICFGLPGAIPVLNKEAVRLAARAAYALGTKPQKFSKFDRKHYFYPDLPKGYQISQFDKPIILGGEIDIQLEDGSSKKIRITRAHMEEDAGKSTHPSGVDYSLVDLNRAGTPLLEIVSEPEMHSAEEAKAYAKELWLRMKYAEVSDVDLYHGNMRFDVNVSVSKDPNILGTRSETKNLNSFRSVERAVTYEINRQIELLEKGEKVVQETRGWLDDKQKTVSQRSKEDAHDYRYFPDPDLPPVVLDEDYIADVEATLPVLLDELRSKLLDTGLDKKITDMLLVMGVESMSGWPVHSVLNCLPDINLAKFVANYLVNTVASKNDISDASIQRPSTEQYKTVFGMYSDDKLSSNNVIVLLESLSEGIDPEKIANEKNLLQVNDSDELESIVEKVIAENPQPVSDVQAGEMKAIGFLVGQVMKASQGKANPAEAQKILKQKLGV